MISASELAAKTFDAIELQKPFDHLIGHPEPGFSMLIAGSPGEGKSTLALQLAAELTEHGNVLYVAAEEGTGYTLQEKIKRLGLSGSDIRFTEWEGFKTLKDQIRKKEIDFVILDSITAVDRYLREFEDFRAWCKADGVGLVVVSHATKTGTYKGDSSLAHAVDTHIWLQDKVAQTKKNRYGPLAEIPVDFGKTERENPDSYEQKDQIRKGITAMKRVIETHKDVPHAMYRKDIGTIDFIWGDAKRGIDHIIKQRDKEGKTNSVLKGQRGKDVVLRLPFVIEKGSITQRQPKRHRIIIRYEPYEVVLRKENGSSWMLTGYRLLKRKNPDATAEFQRFEQSYVQQAYLDSQPEVVAGSENNIRNSQEKGTNSNQNNPQRSERGHVKKARKVKKGARRDLIKVAPLSSARKNPVYSHSEPLVYLGTTEKVIIDNADGKRVMKGHFPMFMSMKKDRLYIVPKKYVSKVKDKVHSSEAAKAFDEFNHYGADDTDYKIDWPGKGTKAVPVGTADEIYYTSDKIMTQMDKKGKMHHYVHDFDKGKRPALVLGHVLIIANLEIGSRGIMN